MLKYVEGLKAQAREAQEAFTLLRENLGLLEETFSSLAIEGSSGASRREVKLLIEDCQRLVGQGLKSAALSCDSEAPQVARSPD